MSGPGRPKNIESPSHLWELFTDFRDEKKGDPIIEIDFCGKDALRVEKPHQRPLTLEGFSCWLYESGVTGNIHDYFSNSRDAYKEFSEICRVIKEIIRTDQVEGGMCGIYNPSITQRLNGLVEKTAADNNTNLNANVQINVVESPVPLAGEEKDVAQ